TGITVEADPKIGPQVSGSIAKWNGSQLVSTGMTESGGNIGIGTAAPATKLDVAGTTRTSELSISARANCEKLYTDASGNVLCGTDASGLSSESDPKVGANAANYVSKWNGTQLVSSAIVESGGRVGIGTSTPAYSLHVSGNAKLGVTEIGNSAASWLRFDYGGGGANNKSIIYATPGNYLSLGSNGNYDELNVVGGNVGIGTTTPTAKLDVNGNVNVNSNRITNVAAPTAGSDAANKSYVDTAIATSSGTAAGNFVAKTGDTMTGALNLSDNAVNTALTAKNIQQQNARASGYAAIAARNPGVSFSVLMVRWDRTNTLETNCQSQINAGWHAQAAIKGNYFNQAFDGTDFNNYSTVLTSQADFDTHKATGTQWWIACSTLPAYSQSLSSSQWISVASGINYSGNVGIGTATPTSNLQIGELVGGNNTDYSMRVLRHGTAATPGTWTSGAPMLSVQDWSGDGPAALDNRALFEVAAGKIASSDPNASNALIMNVRNDDMASILTVNGKGNVGVGTLTPTTRLHVAGSGTQPSTFTGNTPGTFRVWGGAYTADGFTNLDISNASTGGVIGRIGVRNNGGGSYLYLGTSNNYGVGITNQALVIDPNANVGIGTTSPATKLDVAGTINATGFTINGQPLSGGSTAWGSITGKPAILGQLGGTVGSYGTMSVSGSANGYSGLTFTDVSGKGRTLMVHNTADIQGFYNEANAGWSWYFQNGSLTYGSVPIARIPDIGNASVNYSTYGRYVYDRGAYSGAAAWREPADMYVYYSYLGRLVYNNGAYSGSGWVEPSDLGVRYASTAGSAATLNQGAFYVQPGGSSYVRELQVAGRFTLGNGEIYSAGRANYFLALQGDRNLVLYDNGAPVWSSGTGVSDIRLKENVTPLEDVLEDIAKLNIIRFTYKVEVDEKQSPQIGVIAQEINARFPELVYHD
ncbi:MAG TPA: tail fiber domain-containing protein, partial [Bdellovibrionales bacterium]|nr:tail fiber domain-containing protein [Bdellovibrionales bacterium]